MWVLTMVTTALAAQTDTVPMSAQDSTALQVKRTTVWAACPVSYTHLTLPTTPYV